MKDSQIDHSLGGMELSLPSDWYTEQHVYDLEREHIFMREWLCVAREEQVSETGDHRVLDVFGESILLLRNEQGQLRAFYNVCRHRGARLCVVPDQEVSDEQGGEGLKLKGGLVNKRRIVCPYHAWSYDLDGQLLRAPHLGEDMGFDTSEVKLHAVGCETWGGFVFIHLTPSSAKPLSEQLSSNIEALKRYPLGELRIAKSISYEVNANWKVLCENYNECYHCGPVHPELCKIVPAFKNGGAGLDWDKGVPHRDGADTFTFSGTSNRRSFAGLNQDELENHKGDLIYPNMFISLARDHVVVFLLQAQGPDKTQVDCHFLFEVFEIDKPNFNPADAIDFWHLVNRQDWAICERVQQGMSSRIHEYGVFSPMEDWNLDIRRYVKDRIGEHIDDRD